MQDVLYTCENYFVSWLNNSKLEKETLQKITNELYECIGRIEEDPKSEDNESSYKKEDGTEKNHEERVDNIFIPDQETSADDQWNNEREEITHDRKYLQIAIAPLIEAFLNIQVGDVNVAKKQILLCTKYLKSLTEEHDTMEEFIPGFDFLKLCLETHLALKENLNHFSEKEINSICNDFNHLSDKGKAVVYAAKWMFLEALENREDDSLEALQTVAVLDSTNYIWHYMLCMRLRFLRRDREGPYSKPCEKEIGASVAAVEMSKILGGPEYHNSIAGLCQTISEVLRWRVSTKQPNAPITIGDLHFHSNGSIIKYLKKEARQALCRPWISFGESIRYSEIFSAALPHEHRNYEIAILFMTSCLKLKPANSKANHKMGVLYLVGDEDINEAIVYLRKATELQQRNFPAWLDLIKSLLQSPLENNNELDKIFSTIFEISWTMKRASSFKFLHGCYLFMKGETHSAIDMWISVINSLQNEEDFCNENFQNLSHTKRRYYWSEKAIKLESIHIAVQERLHVQQKDDPNKDSLHMLEKVIVTAMKNRRGEVDRLNNRPRHSDNFGSGSRMHHDNAEVDRDDQWRLGSRHTAATYQCTFGNYSRRNNFTANGDNTHNVQYGNRQRRRTPSPDNWRN